MLRIGLVVGPGVGRGDLQGGFSPLLRDRRTQAAAAGWAENAGEMPRPKAS